MFIIPFESFLIYFYAIDSEAKRKEQIIREFLEQEILPLDSRLKVRGIGMIWGVDFSGIDAALALEVLHECVDNHLIIELAGSFDCVLKILPALTIEDELLIKGLNIIKDSVVKVLNQKK